ncbi:MAG TPA: hypothetical protein VGK48_22300, partial [Terriglobia bacterium]
MSGFLNWQFRVGRGSRKKPEPGDAEALPYIYAHAPANKTSRLPTKHRAGQQNIAPANKTTRLLTKHRACLQNIAPAYKTSRLLKKHRACLQNIAP